jgi:DNA-binding NtrC family response regulator
VPAGKALSSRLRVAATAAVIALVATLAALAAGRASGGSASALEWAVHDRWLGAGATPGQPALVVFARDARSDAALGGAAWDRAVLARAVGGLARAGAAAVGLTSAVERPSPPARGGAASDALLGDAIALAGNAVLPIALQIGAEPAVAVAHASWPRAAPGGPAWLSARAVSALPPFADHARAIGHTLAPPDPDGVVRRVPLFVRVDDRLVPALGLALAVAAAGSGPEAIAIDSREVVIARLDAGPLRIPVDGQGRALLGRAAPPAALPFSDLWPLVEGAQRDSLRSLVEGRAALLDVEPAGPTRATQAGSLSDAGIQAALFAAAMGGSWARPASSAAGLAIALALAGVTARLWLSGSWWRALVTVVLLAFAYFAALAAAASLGVLLPVWLPLASVALASGGALLWSQFASTGRIHGLEDEVQEIREALVRQESAVEGLEEDLDAARAAAARSAGAEEALRAQLAAARAEEERTRARLGDLEREVRAARPAESPGAGLEDAERERQRRKCLEVGITTRDPGVLAVFADLEKAAGSPLTILIEGEPGTGKELFARAAHRLSPRADRPFVAVNMAAISPELFEAEMFGHARGSFTGAVGERKGYFELADRGTLFLDEVGELRAEHQGKLLRALQEKSFYRVGATRPTTVDVRVVAASNRDLERGVAEGWFREDLYFRLKGFVLKLPPLRERPADVPLLAARFVEEAAAEMDRPGIRLSEAALAALAAHDWPGNVRELQHCLRQAGALSRSPVISPEDLRLPGAAPRREETEGDAAVLDSLRLHGFDMQVTARALGWDRSTVTQRLKGLGFRALVEAGGDRDKAALALAGSPALARTVALKLREYHEHLVRTVQEFDSADAAVSACRRRFKNLPERHFRSLELLVRQHFDSRPPAA